MGRVEAEAGDPVTHKPVVWLVTRTDAAEVPGGDSRKARLYAEQLNRGGRFHAELMHGVATAADRPRPDIVHMFNLDDPYPLRSVTALAVEHGARVVLSPIAHPSAGLDAARRHAREYAPPIKRLVLAASENAPGLRSWGRSLQTGNRDVSVMTVAQPIDEVRREILSACDLVLPLSQSEAGQVLELVHKAPTWIVPNGLTFFARGAEPRPAGADTMLCVGRVEPRKNTLLLARSAALAGTPIRFVGKPTRTYPRYFDEFLQVVDGNSHLEYVGPLAQQELRGLYLGSLAHVSFSFCEVVSQVDLEARSLGLSILASQHAHSLEYLKPVETFDATVVSDPADGAIVLEQFVASLPTQSTSAPSCPGWDEVVEELTRAYESVLTSGRTSL